MTANGTQADLDLLVAFADGELEGEDRDRIARLVAEDAAAAAQVEAYRKQAALLHGAFDSLLDEPLPDALVAAARTASPWRRTALPVRVAAGIALVLIGGLGGWFAHGIENAPKAAVQAFTREALSAHRIYTVEVRHPVEVAAREEEHLVKWLTKRLGDPVHAPNLAALGFSLVGGRLLSSVDGRPAAQLMYQDDKLRRLTLYIHNSGSKRETAFQFERADGISMFYWIDHPFSYAIIGEIDRPRLLKISRAVYEQIEG